MWKNVSIIINDDEDAWRIEDGVSPLKLFSCNHENADDRMALHTSKSNGNVVIVAKDTGLLMLVLFTVIQRVRYQKNGY